MQEINNKTRLVPKLRFKEFGDNLGVIKLDELVTFKSGGTPPKDNPIYWGGNIPWISATSMYGKYYSTSERTITEEGLKNGSKLALKGSLLLLVRGSMLFNKIPIGIAEVDVAFNQDLKALATKENSDTDFLYHWFGAKQNLLLGKVVGTGIGAGKLDTEDLKNLNVLLPSLPEQQKIAAFLSAVDEKIQQLTRTKELLEQYKKGVMQQIFSGELRFKGDDGKSFSDWAEKRLGELCESISSGKSKSSDNGPFSLYGSTGVIGSCQDYSHDGKFILIARVGANAGTINLVEGAFGVSDNTLVVNCNEQLHREYVYFYLGFSNLNKLIFGSGQPLITGGQLKDLKLKVPCLEEQQKIAEFLSSIDAKIERVTDQITHAQTFKKGLLQQMFV